MFTCCGNRMKRETSFDFKYGSRRLADSFAENLCSSDNITDFETLETLESIYVSPKIVRIKRKCTGFGLWRLQLTLLGGEAPVENQ
mmetsp:Transcript_34049/g.67122  ORF Transcript_34049/g.67122 Transcript_34049/m.67122 type:complete len:86 (+) Transcript_34049:710-967(+)